MDDKKLTHIGQKRKTKKTNRQTDKQTNRQKYTNDRKTKMYINKSGQT